MHIFMVEQANNNRCMKQRNVAWDEETVWCWTDDGNYDDDASWVEMKKKKNKTTIFLFEKDKNEIENEINLLLLLLLGSPFGL